MNNSTSPAPSSASSCDTPSVLGFGMFAYFIRLISIIFVVWQMTQNLGGFRESFRLSFQTLKTSSTRTLSIQKSLRNSSLICLFLTLVVQAIDQILRDVNRMLGYPCRVCSEVVQNFTSMFCQIFLVLTFIFMSYVTLFNYSKLSTVARGTSLYYRVQACRYTSFTLSLMFIISIIVYDVALCVVKEQSIPLLENISNIFVALCLSFSILLEFVLNIRMISSALHVDEFEIELEREAIERHETNSLAHSLESAPSNQSAQQNGSGGGEPDGNAKPRKGATGTSQFNAVMSTTSSKSRGWTSALFWRFNPFSLEASDWRSKLKRNLLGNFTVIVLSDIISLSILIIATALDICFEIRDKVSMITISWTAVHMFASFGLLDGLLKGLQQRGQVQGTSAALHTNTRTETDFVSTNIQEDRLKMKAGAVGLITAQLLDEAPGNQMEWFYEADGLQGARGKDGKGGDVADIRVDTSDLNHGKEVSVSPIKQFFFGVRKSSA